MVELFPTTISKRNPLYTWYSDYVEVSLSLPLLLLLRSLTPRSKYAVNATLAFLLVLRIAVRRNADAPINFAQRRSLSNKLPYFFIIIISKVGLLIKSRLRLQWLLAPCRFWLQQALSAHWRVYFVLPNYCIESVFLLPYVHALALFAFASI